MFLVFLNFLLISCDCSFNYSGLASSSLSFFLSVSWCSRSSLSMFSTSSLMVYRLFHFSLVSYGRGLCLGLSPPTLQLLWCCLRYCPVSCSFCTDIRSHKSPNPAVLSHSQFDVLDLLIVLYYCSRGFPNRELGFVWLFPMLLPLHTYSADCWKPKKYGFICSSSELLLPVNCISTPDSSSIFSPKKWGMTSQESKWFLVISVALPNMPPNPIFCWGAPSTCTAELIGSEFQTIFIYIGIGLTLLCRLCGTRGSDCGNCIVFH